MLPREIFRHCETNTYHQKIVKSPFLSVSFFDTRFSVKQRRLAIPNFLGLWDTDFDKKSWYTTLSSKPKPFSIPEVFWNTEGFPYDSSRYCENKTLTKNRDTPASSLIHKSFRYPKILKERRVPLRNFWTQWDKKILAQKMVSLSYA